MVAADIISIATTVATAQVFCDLLAYWRVYSQEPYERSRSLLSRNKWKRDKAKEESDQLQSKESTTTTTSSSSSNKKGSKMTKADRQAKKLQRAEDDLANAQANVARRHTVPSILTSVFFFILLKILGTEYKGQVVAILPFTPFRFLQRITSRSLEFGGDTPFESSSDKVTDVGQACAFMFIYLLTTMSVKFYVSQFVGTKPPKGADGLMSIVDSPMGHNILKQAGIDPQDLKVE